MTTREVFKTLNREEAIGFFNTKKTDKEIYDILVSKGLTDSFDTFKTESEKVFTEKVSSMSKEDILSQIEGVELTEEQLEMIAGGSKQVDTVWIGTAIVGGAAVGIAGAAAAMGV